MHTMRRTILGLFFTSLCVSNTAAQTIFEDDLNDNAAGWTFESLSGNFGISDGADAVFGFDYAPLGIPEAPNSKPGDDATRGLRIRANNTGASAGQAAAYIDNPAFAGQYTVQVDMWLNWAADESLIGTTEHGGLYVGKDTPQDPAPNLQPVQRGAGAIFSTDGDCVNCDHILTKNRYELDTYSGQYSVRDFGFGNQPGYDGADVNTDPANGAIVDLPALFPSFNISEATGGAQGTPEDLVQAAGTVGFQWVTITAEIDPAAPGNGPGPGVGTATFTVKNAATGESFVLGTVDNSRPDILDDDGNGVDCEESGVNPDTEDICVNLDDPFAGDSPVDLEGRISLILIDFFSGAPSDANLGFALFDNVIVVEAARLAGDFNKDGQVDGDDFLIWQQSFGTESGATPNSGDANGDGAVNGDDFLIWQQQFGSSVGEGGLNAPNDGDANGDGAVNGDDFLVWQQQFGSSVGEGGLNAAVPEPSATVLLSATLIASTLWRRRSNR